MLSLWLVCHATLALAEPEDRAEMAARYGTSDPEMLDAIAQAQRGLDDFVALSEAPEPGTSTYKLKVLVREGELLEYFWVMPFQRVSDGFEGRLANKPEVLETLHLGDTIRFQRDNVVDWGYVRNGRQVGSLTVCVSFRHMPAYAVEYFRKTNGFDC